MNPSIHYTALLPEILITLGFVVVLLADLWTRDGQKSVLTFASGGCCVLAGVAAVWFGATHEVNRMFDGAYVVDDFSLVVKAFLAFGVAAVFMFGGSSNWRGEYCLMLLGSLLGGLLLSSARDLLVFVVAFELLAVPGYMLTGWDKVGRFSFEGVVKYFLLGVVSTAVMLYGISLLFGVAGSTSYERLRLALDSGAASTPLVAVAVVMLLVGLAFKMSAAPMHFWAPDAYQSAPLPVAAYLSVVTKVAGFGAFLAIAFVAIEPASDIWRPLLWIVATLSMTVGNLVALRQDDLVRLLAYSSVAQAGYALIPIAVYDPMRFTADQVVSSVVQFLLVYAVSNLGAFLVLRAIKSGSGSTGIAALRGIATRAPFAAVSLSIFFISLAGVPPFAGWFGKVVVFRAAIESSETASVVLGVIAALNSVVGLVYYVRVLKAVWLDRSTGDSSEELSTTSDMPVNIMSGLVVLVGAAVVLGVVPGFVTQVGGWSSIAK